MTRAEVRGGEVVVGPAVVPAVALAVAGCSSADEPAVREVASSFAGGDARTRCDLLAPATRTAVDAQGPCAQTLAELPLGSGEVTDVQVWGSDALVHLSDDTLFLTLGDTGWQISAGACTPAAEGPYECRLEA